MERRDGARRPRRLAVRFSIRGSDKPRTGFTTNISPGGMFIGSNQVYKPGTRLRIEVLDSNLGFVVEGVVARAVRPAPALRAIQTSGMGVRFLQVEELVAELLPHTEEIDLSPDRPSLEPEQSRSQETGAKAFAVQFATLDDLRVTYERDIAQGGLFITTGDLAPVGAVVTIHIQPPSGSEVRFQARVVHCQPSGEHNLLAGMGLEILDLDSVTAQLKPLLVAG